VLQRKAFSVIIQQNPYNKNWEKEVSSESSVLECLDLVTKRDIGECKA